MHIEIIFEGQIMISCKKKHTQWYQGKVALERDLMMRVDSRFSEI
jgi:hypothetical protein